MLNEENNLFSNKEENTNNFPIGIVLFAFASIIFISLSLWYLLSNKYGDEVSPPLGLREKIETHFNRTSTRKISNVRYFYCSDFFSNDTAYVAHVKLGSSDIFNFQLSDIYESYRIRAIQNRDYSWHLIPSPESQSKQNENIGSCSLR